MAIGVISASSTAANIRSVGLFAASRQACARRSRLRRTNRVVLGKMAGPKVEEQVKTPRRDGEKKVYLRFCLVGVI